MTHDNSQVETAPVEGAFEESAPLAQEFMRLARNASNEIKKLRREIEILSPRAEAYDNIHRILALTERRGGLVSFDISREIDRRLKELEPNP